MKRTLNERKKEPQGKRNTRNFISMLLLLFFLSLSLSFSFSLSFSHCLFLEVAHDLSEEDREGQSTYSDQAHQETEGGGGEERGSRLLLQPKLPKLFFVSFSFLAIVVVPTLLILFGRPLLLQLGWVHRSLSHEFGRVSSTTQVNGR